MKSKIGIKQIRLKSRVYKENIDEGYMCLCDLESLEFFFGFFMTTKKIF